MRWPCAELRIIDNTDLTPLRHQFEFVGSHEIVLELRVKFGKPRGAMKKLFAAMALLTLVGTVLLTGCKQEEAPPEPAPTDAPAQP